jgi:hypothetical protein
MKKLQKLTFDELADQAITLTIEEQMAMYAGTAPIDGLCFFEALAILSEMMGCNYGQNYYMSTYAASHGGYSSLFTLSFKWTGSRYENVTVLKGVSYQDTVTYLQTEFAATHVNAGDIPGVVGNGGKLYAVMDTGAGSGHAVVLTGYDAATNTYTYQDAGGTKTIEANRLVGGAYHVTDGYVH